MITVSAGLSLLCPVDVRGLEWRETEAQSPHLELCPSLSLGKP